MKILNFQKFPLGNNSNVEFLKIDINTIWNALWNERRRVKTRLIGTLNSRVYIIYGNGSRTAPQWMGDRDGLKYTYMCIYIPTIKYTSIYYYYEPRMPSSFILILFLFFRCTSSRANCVMSQTIVAIVRRQ